jgi:tRNA(Ile)-lysidine synthase
VSVESRVRASGLLDGPVLVLLSGGRDSVCLLDLAVRISPRVRALHVDYRLRQSSAGDAEHCAALCERLGVALEVVRAGRPAGNVQAWAREVRYAEARRVATGDAIATGHTASDQAETVLYRLAASPGRRALLGMRERERGVVRPLLGITRAESTAYCRERGLEWRDDPGNESRAYARNRARAALAELHPAAEANVLRTLALLRDEAEVLDALVDDVITNDQAALRAMPRALARLCLQRLTDEGAACESPGGSDAGAAWLPAPAVARRADELLSLGARGGSASLDLGGGLRAVAEYGRLRFERADPPQPAEPATLTVPGRVAFAGGELRSEEVPDGTLDLEALAPPLEVRAWRAGDRMRPLGLGGSRSLQDLFTDRKVPRARRSRLPVVVSDGEIAWVAGVATGEAFGLTAGTRRRARLTWQP